MRAVWRCGRCRAEVPKVLRVLKVEDFELRWRPFESVKDGVPTFLHALDDVGHVGGACHGVRVGDRAGLGDEVTSDDFVQLGAVWVVFVIEFCLGLGISIVCLWCWCPC